MMNIKLERFFNILFEDLMLRPQIRESEPINSDTASINEPDSLFSASSIDLDEEIAIIYIISHETIYL